MIEGTVEGFLPSRDGFPFPNAWPHVAPIRLGIGRFSIGIGDAARGLCGGMVFAVADLRASGSTMPHDPQPAVGTPRFRYVVRRQVQSFDWLRLPLRFWLLMAAPSGWRRRWTAISAWPAIRRDIDAGRLGTLGLVRVASRNPFRLGGNHQVLAWRYALDGDLLTLGLYDPNHPGADDVELVLALAPGGRSVVSFEQSTGEPLVGVLAAPYAQTDPRPFRSPTG